VTSIQPELWVERAADAVAFYQAAFGAIVLHTVGGARTSSPSSPSGMPRSGSSGQSRPGRRGYPKAVGGATGRTLLVVDRHRAQRARCVAPGGGDQGLGGPRLRGKRRSSGASGRLDPGQSGRPDDDPGDPRPAAADRRHAPPVTAQNAEFGAATPSMADDRSATHIGGSMCGLLRRVATLRDP
jgi:PhnB protein